MNLLQKRLKNEEQEKSNNFQNNIDIDKQNFIISNLLNLDQQDLKQTYINTLLTDIGQILLDSAKQIFGVILVNTNYTRKKKSPTVYMSLFLITKLHGKEINITKCKHVYIKGDKSWFHILSLGKITEKSKRINDE